MNGEGLVSFHHSSFALDSSINSTKKHPLTADVALFLVVLFWGINMPVMKFALSRMDIFLFNAMRLTLSALALTGCVVWYRFRHNGDQQKRLPSRRHWPAVGLYVFLGGFAYQFLFLLGINATTAGNAAVILSAIPMWTAVLAFLLLKEKLSVGGWIGLLIAISGVVIVTLGKPQNSGAINVSNQVLLGNVLVSAAAFSWALLSVISRKIMKTVSPLNLAFFCVAFTLPLHYLIAVPALNEFGKVFQDPLLIAAIVYSGVFSTGFAIALWNFGVKNLGAAHAAGFQNLVPLIALGASWILISEIPFPMQVSGGVLIIAGMIVMRRNRKPVVI